MATVCSVLREEVWVVDRKCAIYFLVWSDSMSCGILCRGGGGGVFWGGTLGRRISARLEVVRYEEEEGNGGGTHHKATP